MAAMPVDLEHLNQYTAGDAALQAEVFGLFREQAAMWVRLLEPKADDDAWTSAAHTIKGSARGIGAFALADACATAELLVGAASTPVRRSLVAQTVRARLDEVLSFIDAADYKATVAGLKSAPRESGA